MQRAHGGAIVLLVAALMLATPGVAAAASFIVYGCGEGSANLCRINPDGSGQMALTSDGRPGSTAYGSPSLSRDGNRLAFNVGNESYVVATDPAQRGQAIASGATIALLRPDGGWLATVESFPEQTLVPGLTGPNFFTTFTSFVVTYDLGSRQRSMTHRLPATLAWAGNRLVTNGSNTQSGKQTLCLLKPDHVACERPIAQDNGRDLTDPAVSPDSSLLAVAGCAEPRRARCGLSVYDMASGAKLRDLTAGPSDTAPAWSPDGSTLVFTRGADLFLIDASAGPGAERLLVRGGRSATWGGTPDAPPAPVTPPIAEPPAPSQEDATALAIQTAADETQVPAEQLAIVRVEPMDWPDSSLGCPMPGRAYAQIVTPGFVVTLTPDEGATEIQVHTGRGSQAAICSRVDLRLQPG